MLSLLYYYIYYICYFSGDIMAKGRSERIILCIITILIVLFFLLISCSIIILFCYVSIIVDTEKLTPAVSTSHKNIYLEIWKFKVFIIQYIIFLNINYMLIIFMIMTIHVFFLPRASSKKKKQH